MISTSINQKNSATSINFRMLPEQFTTVVNDHLSGFKKVTIPVFNDYQERDGGYIALYTRDAEAGLYSVGDEGGSEIYVMGLVRVKGSYNGRIFIPAAGKHRYQLGDDITRDTILLSTCKKYFPEMQNDFWIGGDTGGWIGNQTPAESQFYTSESRASLRALRHRTSQDYSCYHSYYEVIEGRPCYTPSRDRCDRHDRWISHGERMM